MCLCCIEWQKGKLTKDEALRNLKELRLLDDLSDGQKRHLWEVEQSVKLDDHARWLKEYGLWFDKGENND